MGRVTRIGGTALALLLAVAAVGCPGDGSRLLDEDDGPKVTGPVDDFEDGSVQGWVEGPPSPNPPSNIPDGGPDGAGDNYLENISTGGFGPGGLLVMYNQDQWTGDYVTTGITRIEAMMANFGASELFMRIAIEGNPFERYGSTVAQSLPADGQWYALGFDLDDASLTEISGGASLQDVLSNVGTLRILSAEGAPSWIGDGVVANLGVDDIRGVGE